MDEELKALEELSMAALSQHCPLCGGICANYHCEPCDFTYEPGKLYFSKNTNVFNWEKPNK